MEHLPTAPSFVGIDVSKDRLDVYVRPSGQTFAVQRNDKGLEDLVSELRKLAPALIVLEATGGFEVTVAAALASANLPVAVVNPRQIRDFARAVGRPRPTHSTLRLLPCSPNAFGQNHVRSLMPTARAWRNWSHAAVRWWK